MNNVITDIANGDGFSQRNGWFGRIVRQTIKLSDFTSHPVVGVVNGKISTTTAEFDLSADKKEDVTTKLILNDVRTLSEIRNDKTVLEEGKDYTISGDDSVNCSSEKYEQTSS